MDRVLEIGGHAAGYCGRLHVHAGDDVVRVETGDTPPAWASTTAMDTYLHAGKRRIATSDPGLIRSLADKADIVVCEAGTADALLALGFDDWQTGVKLAITPFGLTGPKRNWRATPSTLLAMGGYTYLTGDPGRSPLTLPGHYVEFQAGALGYTSAVACRFNDTDDCIDLAMLDTVMSLSQFTTVRWHCTGEIRTRHGNDFYFVVPSNLYPCEDGWIYINIVPTFWDAFVVFVDMPELLVDERFMTNDLRIEHREVLHTLTAPFFGGQTRQALFERAEAVRVPLGMVQSLAEVLADPHLAERRFWHPAKVEGQPVKCPDLPFQLDDRQLRALELNEPRTTGDFGA